jgi:membrane fusion protein, multidrug efflux system
VPRTAITYSLYGDSVYVVKPEEAAKDAAPAQPSADMVFVVERRFVTTGQVRGDLVAVTSGLKAGEQVVTTGQLKLNNGSRVKIDNSQALKPPPELPKP